MVKTKNQTYSNGTNPRYIEYLYSIAKAQDIEKNLLRPFKT